MILDIDTNLVAYYGEEQGTKLGSALFQRYFEILAVIEKDAESIKSEYF